MKRLTASLRQDFRLHTRYGFYYAAAFITLFWVAVLSFIPPALRPFAITLIIFVDLGVIGFYFLAGQILFEKNERTIFALNVTPLTFLEYLGAKLLSLSTMALLVSFAVTILVYGLGFNMILFSLGVILMSGLVLTVGLIGVAPYRSISQFILPSQIYFLAVNLPLININDNILFYLVPTQGSLLLLQSAFIPVDPWRIAYAVFYQLIWIVFLIRIAGSRFERYIVARTGGKA